MDKLRLPDYLKKPIASLDNHENKRVRDILKEFNLNTVCDGARCPNKCECYSNLTATFLIMGKTCTRNCSFCNIEQCCPDNLDEDEPKHVALAIKKLGLKYAVITSVTRDDLDDYGSNHFCKTIFQIRKHTPDVKIEILTPDFCGSYEALNNIIKYKPDVFNHNIETVARLYGVARQMADYKTSLAVLKYIKVNAPDILTKTGIMVGLGESEDEIYRTFCDIKNAQVDILTVGQYIAPSKKHLPVRKYYTQEDFSRLEQLARKAGIEYPLCAPLVRSSYRAAQTYDEIMRKKIILRLLRTVNFLSSF